MASSQGRFAGFVIVVIVLTALILLCLSFLAIGVGVAVVGNDDYNNCKGSVSFCEQVLEQSKHASYALMAAASVVTILLVPALATVVAYFVIELVSGRAGKCDVRSEEQTDQGEATEDLDFHDYVATKLDRTKLKQLRSAGPAAMLYFTFIFFTLSLIGALWMLVIAYDNPSQKTAKLWPFIITELIMGLACPILACIGFALLSIVGTYIMAEQVDLRIIINKMLPSVVLKEDTSENLHWVIVQHYHIKLKESWGKAGQFIHAIDRNRSTWILAIISALAVVLSVSNFINRSFVQTLTVPVTEYLEESDICLTYSCFTPVTFDHLNVNCSEVNLVDLGNIDIVHCFKFIPLSSEIIANLSISVGFYLATVYFLQAIFVAATVLHVGKSHKVWGSLFILAGCVTLIGAMVYIFLPHFANIRLDVILAGQIFLVAIYLVLIGILLCTGDVLVIENKKPPAAARKHTGSITDGEEMTSNV